MPHACVEGRDDRERGPAAKDRIVEASCPILQVTANAELVARLRRLATVEGYTVTPIPGVRLLRSDRPLTRTPVLYEPGIVFVCQGRKRGFLGDRVYRYDARHYLAVAVPLPFAMETDATAAKPLLAVYLQLDFRVAADVLLAIGERLPSRGDAFDGMRSTRIDARLEDALLRLLRTLASPLETEVLGPAVLREIYFRVMLGDQGAAVRAALATRGPFGRIARSLDHIHAAFREPLPVARLAGVAGMGAASFHAHFKRLTSMSPLQYVKSVRLHQARVLMIREALTAAAAAHAVGYESPTQFSREFKRLFGRPPAREAERLRAAYVLPPSGPSPYVSSH